MVSNKTMKTHVFCGVDDSAWGLRQLEEESSDFYLLFWTLWCLSFGRFRFLSLSRYDLPPLTLSLSLRCRLRFGHFWRASLVLLQWERRLWSWMESKGASGCGKAVKRACSWAIFCLMSMGWQDVALTRVSMLKWSPLSSTSISWTHEILDLSLIILRRESRNLPKFLEQHTKIVLHHIPWLKERSASSK